MKESINWRDRARVLSNKVVVLDAQRLELLEALKEFVNNSSVQAGFPSLCEEAEKAITKAEGGE